MTSIYSISYHRKAEKALHKIPKTDARRITRRIGEALRENPFAGKALKGRYRGLYSLRVGRFRVIYKIEGEKLQILILNIGERQGIYDDIYF